MGPSRNSSLARLIGTAVLGTDQTWIKFLSTTGAVMLTFLAGAELDPAVMRKNWKEASTIGFDQFPGSFPGLYRGGLLGTRLVDRGQLARWNCSVHHVCRGGVCRDARVRFQHHQLWEDRAGCLLLTDLGTVVTLGLMFSPFTVKTLIFAGAGVAAFIVLPWLTPRFFRRYGGRPSELEAKFLLLFMFRPGRAGPVGGQRTRAACLPDGDGAGGHGRQGPCPGAPAAHADLRPAHAVLLHPGRLVCLPAGAGGRARDFPRAAVREDWSPRSLASTR